jgi:cytochrome c biogenesis protein CcmG/thiol:disulfide interchange protein DsbE
MTLGSRCLMTTGAAAVALCLAVPAVRAIEGRPAPDVALPDVKGATVRLGAFKGRVVLVDFWASWCLPCRASFPALDALSREYEPQGATILAINVDEKRSDADAFLSAFPHTMTVLFDPKGQSPQAFGVRGMPSSFVIDRAGNIRFTHMGYTSAVAQQYRQELARLLAEH